MKLICQQKKSYMIFSWFVILFPVLIAAELAIFAAWKTVVQAKKPPIEMNILIVLLRLIEHSCHGIWSQQPASILTKNSHTTPLFLIEEVIAKQKSQWGTLPKNRILFGNVLCKAFLQFKWRFPEIWKPNIAPYLENLSDEIIDFGTKENKTYITRHVLFVLIKCDAEKITKNRQLNEVELSSFLKAFSRLMVMLYTNTT